MGAGEEVDMSKGEVVGEGVGDRGGEKWGVGGSRVYNINLICQSKKKTLVLFSYLPAPTGYEINNFYIPQLLFIMDSMTWSKTKHRTYLNVGRNIL